MKNYLFAFMLSMTSLAALNSSYAMTEDDIQAREKFSTCLRAAREAPVLERYRELFDTSPVLECTKLQPSTLAFIRDGIRDVLGGLPEGSGTKHLGAKVLMELEARLQNYPAFFEQVAYLMCQRQHANAVKGLSIVAQSSEASPEQRAQACEMKHGLLHQSECYQDQMVPHLILWSGVAPAQQGRIEGLLEEVLRRSPLREDHLQAAEYYARHEVDKAARSYVTALSLPPKGYEPKFGAVESFLASPVAVRASVKALLSADQRTEEGVYGNLLSLHDTSFPSEKQRVSTHFKDFMEQNDTPFAQALRTLLNPQTLPETHPLRLAKAMDQTATQLYDATTDVIDLFFSFERYTEGEIEYRIPGTQVTLVRNCNDPKYGPIPVRKVSFETAVAMRSQATQRKTQLEQQMAINKRMLMDAFSALTPPEQGAVRVVSKARSREFYPLAQLLPAAEPATAAAARAIIPQPLPSPKQQQDDKKIESQAFSL